MKTHPPATDPLAATPEKTHRAAGQETPGVPAKAQEPPGVTANAQEAAAASSREIQQPPEEAQEKDAVTGQEQQETTDNKQAADAVSPDDSGETSSNGRENQVVHTRSVSIKGVLKGQPPPVPVADEEISEDDQVDKAAAPVPDKIVVTEEMIQNAWKAYATTIEKSHPRIFTTLSQQVPTLNEKGIIQIKLNTEAQRENFIHRIKPELIRYFQKTIANVAFVFETNLVENETTVKKVYTDQDKLDFLIRKNPALEKMKSKLNLDFDD